MSLAEDLAALRAATPHCRAVAYIDLEAELVLTADSEAGIRREVLDALAEEARRLLTAAGFWPDGTISDQVVTLTEDGLTVYVRDSAEPGETLCCHCSRAADPDAVATAARAVLTQFIAQS